MRISDWSSDVCSSDLLADHGDGLAGADVEGDVVDHRLPLAGDAERGGEVGDAQDRRGARHGGGGGGAHDSPLSFGSMASRSPSPSRLSANTTTRMARLGNSASQKRSEEQTSEFQSLMHTSYTVLCMTKKNKQNTTI